MKARMVAVFLLFVGSAGAQLSSGNVIRQVRVRAMQPVNHLLRLR
jgi:hypothetical protein